ncbi:redoxin domain-containing protein [Thalassoroseus pseudoceratinae]|uniref:redoxin domain-containing protein n=1 Tax=Thalassoroseus pseudoceratinae TaxID=2713176 RepID=UPI001420C389|nr:redoxin domain-containing protein [Thalassoroseus pseudoceratinae]
MPRWIAYPLACVMVCFAARFAASEETPANAEKQVESGHSFHGEAFNEGPRQSAYLMEGTGAVHFPCSSKKELVQKFVDQGVGQLHGFWYFEAERSFRQAAAIDPDCAIAYWGMAMANKNNSERAKGFIEEAVERLDHADAREKAFINALNEYWNPKKKDRNAKDRKRDYVKALEEISLDHPDDIEAKAFLCLALYEYRRDLELPSTLTVDALMRDVLAANPLHPVHHYRIHLWDYKKPARALNSAAKCGESSPAIAHMWHMPGHIYSRLKRYHDAAWQQEASARVDHAHMIRDRVLPDQIHNFAHNNEWLTRNLVHVGRIHDAVALAKNMTELPHHPKYNRIDKSGSSASYGRLRLFDVLNEAELWNELIQLSETSYLAPTDITREQIKRLRYLGRAQFQVGDFEAAQQTRAGLVKLQATQKAKQEEAVKNARDKALAEAKDKDEKARKKAVADAESKARKPFGSTLRSLTQALNEMDGRQAVADKDFQKGYDLIKKAGRADAFELAELHRLNGKVKEAAKAVDSEVKRNKNEALPLAKAVALQWRLGNQEAAKKAFKELQTVGQAADLDTPVFAALAPIAKELGMPSDWRTPQPRPDDFGTRPPLDDLGPFRWHPTPAESWSLQDAEGRSHSLSSYRGKPVVVIFYLGAGCLHCAQQLQAFGPKTKEFQDAGIELIAISTDDIKNLRRSHENYRDGVFPFPLVSDAEREVFKAYRCFDDFEGFAMHGTFLIDGSGLVRWQDISYEPFMDPDFVLQEAERLLGQSQKKTVITALKPAAPAVAEKQNRQRDDAGK